MQSGGHLGFGVTLKKSKMVISTSLDVLGQNKSKNCFGSCDLTDNHFGWKLPGYQLARGLINHSVDMENPHQTGSTGKSVLSG